MSHTPGPWSLSDKGLGVWSTNQPLGDNKVIANCDAVSRVKSENLANARLIAAAPELLEVAQMYELQLTIWIDEIGCSAGNFDGGSFETCEHCQYLREREVIRAAIAKARGEG